MIKRGVDLGGALFGLICLVPIFCVVALVVRVFLGSPVFFSQLRPGLNGRPFRLVKFKTMLDLADQDGRLLPDGERMTRLGSFLRSTSLDELPELWNVLRGEMSLVGPRPLLMEYLPLYNVIQRRRHEVKPGITGWAQVHGRNAISWEEKFELDVWYVDNRGFLLDLRIIFLTLGKVLGREGVNRQGYLTTPRFKGSGER